jgi:hypothetical protein
MLVRNAITAISEDEPRQARSGAESVETELRPGRFAAFLGLLVAISFGGVLFGGRTFVFRDFGLFSYPVALFHRESFWRGELPLWNPLSYCGLPFLAQWNTMTLYPPSLIYMIFPLSWSLPFFCIAHLFWGGLGMYFLAKSFTRHSMAAALAGVAFSFNGLTLSLMMWQSHEATFSWVPWVLWLGQRAWREGGNALLCGTIAGAMQMLAGGPETIALTWVFLFLLACGDWIRKEAPRRAVVCRFVSMVILVTLICAAQLLPFLQLLVHSQRDSGFGSGGWSMPAWGWANLIVPLFHTTPSPQGIYLQDGQYAFSSYYVGGGLVLLIMIAVRYATDWRARLAALLLLIGLILALGDSGVLYRLVRACIPALGFSRYPVKFVILVCALSPFVAAFGFEALARSRGKMGKFELGCMLTLLLLMAGILLLQPKSSQQTWRATETNGLQRAAVLLSLFLLIELYLRTKARQQLICGGLILVVFWLDFQTHMPNVNPTVSPVAYSANWVESGRNWKSRPKLGEARAMVAPGPEKALNLHTIRSLEDTYMVHRLGLFSDCNLIEGIPKLNGFFSLVPAEINLATFMVYEQTNLNASGLLDFMGVSQVLTSADTFDWVERTKAMPLVTVGQQPLFSDDQTVLNGLAGSQIDLSSVVFLPTEARGTIAAAAQPLAKVSDTKFGAQTVSFRVLSPSESVAVVSQTYFPGWEAYIDGRPAKLWRANYAFQAVDVPPGQHEIKLKYRDKAFLVGVVLSGIGCLISVVFWVWCGPSAPLRALRN